MTTSPVMTVTDELLREFDSIAEYDDDDNKPVAELRSVVGRLTAELRRLRAENAELAKDAWRLEWMVTEGAVIARMNGTGRPMCYQVSFPFESCQQLDWFPSWREAVDAMMATQ